MRADEALAILKTQHCDLAVIDIVMPVHDVLWLAGELQREHFHTAVVLATAYASLLGAARTLTCEMRDRIEAGPRRSRRGSRRSSDATSPPRRRRVDSAEAVSKLLRCCGAQFDPEIVAAFVAALGTR